MGKNTVTQENNIVSEDSQILIKAKYDADCEKAFRHWKIREFLKTPPAEEKETLEW